MGSVKLSATFGLILAAIALFGCSASNPGGSISSGATTTSNQVVGTAAGTLTSANATYQYLASHSTLDSQRLVKATGLARNTSQAAYVANMEAEVNRGQIATLDKRINDLVAQTTAKNKATASYRLGNLFLWLLGIMGVGIGLVIASTLITHFVNPVKYPLTTLLSNLIHWPANAFKIVVGWVELAYTWVIGLVKKIFTGHKTSQVVPTPVVSK